MTLQTGLVKIKTPPADVTPFQALLNGIERFFFGADDPPAPLSAKELRLLKQFPFLCRLSEEQRARFMELCQVFLGKVSIQGMEGIVPTLLDRVSLAASCALLYVGRPEWAFPPVRSVFISRNSFDERSYQPTKDGKWFGYYCPTQDAVYLKQQAIRRSFCNIRDGFHPILHEFAHAVDAEDGAIDGHPARMFAETKTLWGAILEREQGKASAADAALRRYGAKNLEEAFAVSIEHFFEQPMRLKEKAPDLYVLLSIYLNQDPARYDEQIFKTLCDTVTPVIESRKKQLLDGADIREGKIFLHNARPAYFDRPALYVCYRTKRGTWSLPKPVRLHLLAKDLPWKPRTEKAVTLEIVGYQPRRISRWGKFPPLLPCDVGHVLVALGKKTTSDLLLQAAIEKVWHSSLVGSEQGDGE